MVRACEFVTGSGVLLSWGGRMVGLLVFCAVLMNGAPGVALALEWVQQQGTDIWDNNYGVSADGLGSVYVTGQTFGSLGGPNVGGYDAFLSRYDAAGNLLWTAQLGSDQHDWSTGVSADGLGNVFITGWTGGSIGGPLVGASDAFVSRYDNAGNLLWTNQIGTTTDDRAMGVSADGFGNVYIAGWTFGSLGGPQVGSQDAFLFKYDSAGTLLWSRQLGAAPTVYAQSVSADGLGNVYISGATSASLDGPNAGASDAFVAKYDGAGNLLWTRQVGSTVFEESRSVSADVLGNVYVAGYTYGNMFGPNAGVSDIFLVKYDAAGNLLWSQQFGTNTTDLCFGVSTDGLGNVYLSGTTDGSLAGPNIGSGDVLVVKFDSAGNIVWSEQIGSAATEFGESLSADGLGAVYLSGTTTGNFGGINAGEYDVFVAKFSDPIPEPTSLALLLSALSLVLARRR